MFNKPIKKSILFAGLILLVTAAVAFSHGFGNRYGGHMMGYDGYNGHMGYGRHMMGFGPGGDRGYDSNLSDQDLTQLDQARESFYNDTRELRDQIQEKRFSLGRELDKKNPDADKVTQLQKELSGLENEFDKKGIEYQLKIRKLLPEKDFSTGYGPRGRGGYCW